MATAIPLTAEFTKQHMARAVPGAFYDRESKAWVLGDPTPRGAAVALRLFPEIGAEHPELIQLRDALLQDVRPFDNATPYDRRVEAPNVAAALEAEGKAFYDFQDIDLGYLGDVLRTHKGAYLGWERGLGKTLGTCALIEDLGARAVLVVAPNTAKRPVWHAEVERWLPQWFDWVLVLPNEKTKRERTMRHVKECRRRGESVCLIAHYEALAIIAGKNGRRIGRGWDQYGTWDLVAADEAHRIWNTDAQMTKALKKVPAAAKLALSGSIIQNHAEELFSPLQWLFPDSYRSKWRDWNDRFLDYVDGGWGRICVGIKPERLDEMRKELGVFMVYRRKEDELDLPDRTEQTLMIDLSPAQRKAYDELARTCMTELEDETKVKAADGLVLLTRLRQIATGLDLLAETVEDSAKLDLAIDLIEDAEDEAFVVFSWYKAAAEALAERLEAKGIGTFIVDGDVKHDERARRIDAFQAGEGRVFIGTLSTLSESVTLTRASNAIFLDRSWNPATNVQAADRIYRIGQDKAVTITHIVARDTVDELRVLPALANKEALRRTILGGL